MALGDKLPVVMETDFEAELSKIRTEMLNKVNKSGDTIAGDLVIPVGIRLSFHTNGYFGYYLRDNGEKLQVLDHDNHMLLQFGYNSVPETVGGARLATATKPEEHALPMAEGVSAFMRSKYFKSQDNIVTFYAAARKQSGFFDGDMIASLPAGFRSMERIDFPATFSTLGGDRTPGFAMLFADGTLHSAANGAGLEFAYVFGTFVATA